VNSHPLVIYKYQPDDPGWGLDAWRRIPRHFTSKGELERYTPQLLLGLAELPRAISRDLDQPPYFRKSGEGPGFPLRRFVDQILRPLARLGRRPLARRPWYYPHRLRHPERMLLVWKSVISDLRIRWFLDVVADLRVVYIVRHPCGYVASVKEWPDRGLVVGSIGELAAMEPLTTAVVERYGFPPTSAMSPVEREALLWLVCAEEAARQGDGSPRFRSFTYEDLCREPVTTARDVFDFVGLEWSDATERFLSSSTRKRLRDRILGSRAYFSVYQDSAQTAERWKTQLSSLEADKILAIVGRSPLMARWSG
jgi:hypothetical protein